jgi:Fe-S-cluster containining protein
MSSNLKCEECGAKCCKYLAMEIDKPVDKEDYDKIRWYLLHKNVHVFIDHEEDWCVEFESECGELGENDMCQSYERRPRVCRAHGHGEDCEFHGDGEDPHIVKFSTVKEFEEYLDARGKKWRYRDHGQC